MARDFEFKQSKAFWHRKDLSYAEKSVYAVLCSYGDKFGNCHPTKDQIAAALDISEKTARTHLYSLQEKGVIDWVNFRDKFGHIRNGYTLKGWNTKGKPTGKTYLLGKAKPNGKDLTPGLRVVSSRITLTKEQGIPSHSQTAAEEQSPFLANGTDQ